MNLARYDAQQPPASLPVVTNDKGAVTALQVGGSQVSPSIVINWDHLRNVVKLAPPPRMRTVLAPVVPQLAPYREGGDLYSPGGGVQCLSARVYAECRHAAGAQIIHSQIDDCMVDGAPGRRVTVWVELASPGRLPIQESAACEMSYADAYARFGKGANETEQNKARIRANLVRVLQTWAERNATRKLLGLPASYANMDALAMLVVGEDGKERQVPKMLVFARTEWDMADPMVAEQFIARGAENSARLFGKGGKQPLAAPATPDRITASSNDPEFAAAIADAQDADDADPIAAAQIHGGGGASVDAPREGSGKTTAAPSLPPWWRWDNADAAEAFTRASSEQQFADILARLEPVADKLGAMIPGATAKIGYPWLDGDPARINDPMKAGAHAFALARLEVWRRAQK